MREISWLCLRSIPSTFQHEVDQGGHIVDVDIALQVAVGIGHVDTCGITGKHIINQGGHIVDVDILVIVHVTTQASVLRGEVARVARVLSMWLSS